MINVGVGMRHSMVVLLVSLIVVSCKGKPAEVDAGFAAVQERGGMAMGVDQYTSSHKFETTPDGGRISLQRDTDDSVAVSQIRAHMRLIQHAFEAGDFSTPAFVHAREMPGTAVLAAKRDAITYRYEELPRGGSVVITTKDPEVLSAIAQFFEAQRSDHHSH
jgi:hypothetical protein